MRLVNVPWDQALDVILSAKNLGMTRVGNVIRIAPMEILKKELAIGTGGKEGQGETGGFDDGARSRQLCHCQGDPEPGQKRAERAGRCPGR